MEASVNALRVLFKNIIIKEINNSYEYFKTNIEQ
jgi:hypothetical protein